MSPIWSQNFEVYYIFFEDLYTPGIGVYYEKMTTAGGKLRYGWMNERMNE
jgi:hypothetical protein